MKTADEARAPPLNPECEEAISTVKSLAVMLGWGNVPPRAVLERSLNAMRAAAEARGRLEGLAVLRTMVGSLMRIESPPWSVATCDPETLCRWMQRQAALAVQIGGPAIALSSEQPGAAAPSGTSGDAGKLERAGIPGTSSGEER